MQKKFIAHILLLPYYALTGLFMIVIALVEGFSGRNRGVAVSIQNSIKSWGLFIFAQLVVVAGTIYSQKGVAILGGISFLATSSLGKYLLWKNGSSAFQSANSSEYKSQSYDYAPTNLQLYEQQELESQKRKEDDYQRRRQQEYYEQQQRENQKHHEEQIRQAEESRRRSWEEGQRKDEENRKNWGRF